MVSIDYLGTCVHICGRRSFRLASLTTGVHISGNILHGDQTICSIVKAGKDKIIHDMLDSFPCQNALFCYVFQWRKQVQKEQDEEENERQKELKKKQTELETKQNETEEKRKEKLKDKYRGPAYHVPRGGSHAAKS